MQVTILNMNNTRTLNSLRNSVVALSLYVVNFVLQFVSRKVFIDHLGADVLGLNTTVTSILQFLNIAELGIGTAVACTLYKPLQDNNQTEICAIVSLQGWLYRRVAYIIFGCGLIVAYFIPQIFVKTSLPMWYAYATFGVLLFSALLTYVVTYKQILLSASQQEYKIQLSYKLSMLVKIFVQIIAVKYFENGYLWWIILEFLFAVIASVAVNKQVNKSFPYLKIEKDNPKRLLAKYPSVKTKVSQLFFHKIASFALTQISPIILYAYTSLTMVAQYGNYTLITMGITSMLAAIFNGLNAGVGNLVAEGNKDRILSVFREIFSSRFLIVCSCAICFYFLCDSFVELWVGGDFVLDKKIVVLLAVIFYLNTMRTVVDSFIQAYGLFNDVWAPLLEAMLNIGISIILGAKFGLIGILWGVIISLLVIVFVWKPIFLFRKGIQHNIAFYVKLYLKHIFVLLITLIPVCFATQLLELGVADGFVEFAIKSVGLFLLAFLFLGCGLYLFESGMRNFISRLKSIVKAIF